MHSTYLYATLFYTVTEQVGFIFISTLTLLIDIFNNFLLVPKFVQLC